MRIEYRIRSRYDDDFINGELTGSAEQIWLWLKDQLNVMQGKENRFDNEMKAALKGKLQSHVFVGRLDRDCEVCQLRVTDEIHQK